MNILQKNKDITLLSNFKTPARAQFYFEICSEEDLDNLSSIYQFAKEENLKTLIIGGGTNMLFAFETFKGIVIKNCLQGWNYNVHNSLLTTYSNEYISEIAQLLENDYGQDLWHRFIGLPGSVGGAVFGNAGCFGLETENNFISARVVDLSAGEILTLSKDEMQFAYRSSLLKQEEGKYFLVDTVFDLSTKIEKYHSDVDNLYFREHKQPKGNTCGSFFKNPKVDIKLFWQECPELYNEKLKAISAGFLIESAGLKGHQIGGAFFSGLHANFLMSDGTATSEEMLKLITYAQKSVKEKFGIEIENEVRIITGN